LRELGLTDVDAYRDYLAQHPSEWSTLDSFCPITISRFYRDVDVFNHLARAVLPWLAKRALAGGPPLVRAWSIGCSCGEEPYTLSLIWDLSTASQAPGVDFAILATEVNEEALERARKACYRETCLSTLPPRWLESAFDLVDGDYCLRPRHRSRVTFALQDVRQADPEGCFDLILCRNLVLTYFEEDLQRELLPRILARLSPGGAFVIGRKERLPAGFPFGDGQPQLGIYRLPS
jgi:chemotaxis protein methyltransferase CheR